MQFLGWEISTGEVVTGYWQQEDGTCTIGKPEETATFIHVAQHCANDIRKTGYKRRLKPRYS